MRRLTELRAATAVLAGVLVAPHALSAPEVSIPIQNHSFEDPPLANGAFSNQGLPGWSEPMSGFGPINPPAFLLTQPVPDGENVAFSNLFDDTAEQIIEHRLCHGDTLTLDVAVGARNDSLTFGGYIIAIDAVLDDDSRIPVASVTSNDKDAIIPDPGRMVRITVVADIETPDGFGVLSNRLAIRLGSFVGPSEQTWFDNVRLKTQTNSIQVPGCVETIQEAIDMAEDGDEIVLAPQGHDGPIDFMGKGVTIRGTDPEDEGTVASTTIYPVNNGEPGLSPSLVSFTSGEGPDSILDGVTLNNYYDVEKGGNVFISGASPTIQRCVLLGGRADLHGGSAYVENGSPLFERCFFESNRADLGGGSVYVDQGSDPLFIGCDFFDSRTEFGSGGAVYIAPGADTTLIDCYFELVTADDFGGAIYIDTRGAVNIQQCEFRGKMYAPLGGAIFSFNSSPSLLSCTFFGISAEQGGAMFAYGGSPTLEGCDFVLNNAFDECLNAAERGCNQGVAADRGIGNRNGLGGAYVQHFGSAEFTACGFYSNQASFGGAIGALDAELTLTGCQFDRNSAVAPFFGGEGGAVWTRGTTHTIVRSGFASNFAGIFGGALFVNSATSGNPNRVGGGQEPSIPIGLISNCVFDHNASSGAGGGAFLQGSGATVANCTFVGNASDAEQRFVGGGGAILAVHEGNLDFEIFNSILWDNSPDQIVGENFGGDPIVVSNSCIQNGLPEGSSLQDGGFNIESFPRFIDAKGPDNDPFSTDDNNYRLANNSPCIDAGDSAALLAVDASGLDRDGLPRELDDPGVVNGERGIVDMGAYEFTGVSDDRCSAADLSVPFGVLNFDDVIAYLQAFGAEELDADLAPDYCVFDFDDVLEYLQLFGAGCP